MLRLHSRVALDSPGMLDEQDEQDEQDVVLQFCSDEQWRQSKCYWNTWGGWTKYWEVLKTIGSDISLQPCWFLNTQIKIIPNIWRLQQCWGNILQFVKILISDVCSPGSDSDLIFCDRFQFVQDEIKFISEWSSSPEIEKISNKLLI